LYFAAIFASADPTLPLADRSEIASVILDDAFRNAMIDNGNALITWDWFLGADRDHPPTIRLANLDCKRRIVGVTCRFDLTREAEVIAAAPASLPTQLSCSASLRRSGDEHGEAGWWVIHNPPEHGAGHSRTTMTCRMAKSAAAGGHSPP
jgi:hypothetical protein